MAHTHSGKAKLAVGISRAGEQASKFAYIDKHGISLRGPDRTPRDNSFSGNRLEGIHSELGIVVKTKSGEEYLARSATPVNRPNVMGGSSLDAIKLRTATGDIEVDKENINFIRAAEWDDIAVCPGCGIHNTHAEFDGPKCEDCRD